MKTTIGKLDPETGKVNVIFKHAGVTHSRDVNACLDATGALDAAATAARVAEVAAGVTHKIEIGALT